MSSRDHCSWGVQKLRAKINMKTAMHIKGHIKYKADF